MHKILWAKFLCASSCTVYIAALLYSVHSCTIQCTMYILDYRIPSKSRCTSTSSRKSVLNISPENSVLKINQYEKWKQVIKYKWDESLKNWNPIYLWGIDPQIMSPAWLTVNVCPALNAFSRRASTRRPASVSGRKAVLGNPMEM